MEQFQKALRIISEKEGVSEEEILEHMEYAVRTAYDMAVAEGNQERLSMWSQIACTGKAPTAVAFIAYVSRILQNAMDME